jgi:anti-sigma factor RsiW
MQIWPLTDDILMAYANGKLPPDVHARIERALVSDPGARARVQTFRETTALLRAAFGVAGTGDGKRASTEAPTPPQPRLRV